MQDIQIAKLIEAIRKDYDSLSGVTPEQKVESLLLRFGSLPWIITALTEHIPTAVLNSIIEHAELNKLSDVYSYANKTEKWFRFKPWANERKIFEKFIRRDDYDHPCEHCGEKTKLFDKIISSFSCSYACSWQTAYVKHIDYDVSLLYLNPIPLADGYYYIREEESTKPIIKPAKKAA